MMLFEVDKRKAVGANPQLVAPASKKEIRRTFFEVIKKGRKFDWAVFDCYPKLCLRQDLKYILMKLHVLHGNME